MNSKPFLTLRDAGAFEPSGLYVSTTTDVTLEWLGGGELLTNDGPVPVLVFREVKSGDLYLSSEHEFALGECFESFAQRAFDDLED